MEGVEVNYNKRNDSIFREIVKIVVIVEVVVVVEGVEVNYSKRNDSIFREIVELLELVVIVEAVIDVYNLKVELKGTRLKEKKDRILVEVWWKTSLGCIMMIDHV